MEMNMLSLLPRTFNCQEESIKSHKGYTFNLFKYHYLSVTSQQTNMKYVIGFKLTNSHTETINLPVCADTSSNTEKKKNHLKS